MRYWLTTLPFIALLASCFGTPELPPTAIISRVDFIKEIKTPEPLTVKVDRQNHIYFIHRDSSVDVIGQDGKKIFELPKKDATGEPLLRKPADLALYNNRIYIIDNSLSQVIIYSDKGKLIDKFGGGGDDKKEFKKPSGIAVYEGVIFVADTGNSRVQVFGNNGVYLYSITGKPDPEKNPPPQQLLYEPASIAIDNHGRLYVIDRYDNTVKVYDALTGQFLSRGKTLGIPVSIVADNSGYFVADMASYSIMKYDFRHALLYSFGTKGLGRGQFADVSGFDVDQAGMIYVADRKRSLVQVLSPDTKPVGEILPKSPPPTSVEWVASIALGKNGGKAAWNGKDILYVVDESNILAYQAGDLKQTLPIKDGSPGAIAVDRNLDLWILDVKNRRVVKIDPQGKELLRFGSAGSGPGRFSDPTDIAVSSSGLIYIADPGNGWVQVFTKDGVFLNVIRESNPQMVLQEPVAVAVNDKNVLHILDTELAAVLTYSPEGLPLSRFGMEGNLDHQFDDPVDLSATTDEIYVLDRGHNNIKIFSPDGHFIRSFGAVGESKGDFRKPVAITGRDSNSFYVTDARNKRIDLLSTIHTPPVVSGTIAKQEMRAVSLTWSPRPESYIKNYHIYRARQEDGPYSLLAASSKAAHRDTTVQPDIPYFYHVTAVAKNGRESPVKLPLSSVPTVYHPPTPTVLQANAREWSVELSWQAENVEFLSHFRIYRKENGEFNLVSKSNTTSFTDAGLEPDTAYSYRVTAVSKDDFESEAALINTKTKIAQKSPLSMETAEISDIFSNTYKIYETEGLGKITITNNTGTAITGIHIAFTIKDFMDFPTELQIAALEPGQSHELPLKAVFNNKILEVTEDTPMQSEIRASYFENKIQQSFTKNLTVNIYEKHRMMWDVRERFATFITPKDPVVLEFVRSVVTQLKDVDSTLQRAAAIFSSLGSLGLTYLPDPSNPYQITSGKTDFVDYIQYPRETLQRKSGDCDDLVALMTSALESIGIKTKVIEVPGHMLMMFSTNIEATDANNTMDDLLIIHDRMFWVPVETTLVGSSFTKAWGRGSKTYYDWQDKDLHLLDIHSAWQTFKPASLPPSKWRPEKASLNPQDNPFAKETKQLKAVWLKLQSQKYLAQLAGNPDNIEALLQVGIIYGKNLEFKKAQTFFDKVLKIDPQNVIAMNNLGNIHFLQEDYIKAAELYAAAAKHDAADPFILINLTRTYLQQNLAEKAAATFKKARHIQPDIAKHFPTLALKLAADI